jgi:hypothetical protein
MVQMDNMNSIWPGGFRLVYMDLDVFNGFL